MRTPSQNTRKNTVMLIPVGFAAKLEWQTNGWLSVCCRGNVKHRLLFFFLFHIKDNTMIQFAEGKGHRSKRQTVNECLPLENKSLHDYRQWIWNSVLLLSYIIIRKGMTSSKCKCGEYQTGDLILYVCLCSIQKRGQAYKTFFKCRQ